MTKEGKTQTKRRIYLNLTNGLEYLLRNSELSYDDIRLIRLQSTACEQKRWDFILNDLDYGFYMDLALGYEVTVVDYSSKRKIPRAVWQGMAFVRFVLNKVWFELDEKVIVRDGKDSTEYFNQEFYKLERTTLRKLKYFKRFLRTDAIKLSFETDTTELDGKYDELTEILLKS